jgi:hypothetical protein
MAGSAVAGSGCDPTTSSVAAPTMSPCWILAASGDAPLAIHVARLGAEQTCRPGRPCAASSTTKAIFGIVGRHHRREGPALAVADQADAGLDRSLAAAQARPRPARRRWRRRQRRGRGQIAALRAADAPVVDPQHGHAALGQGVGDDQEGLVVEHRIVAVLRTRAGDQQSDRIRAGALRQGQGPGQLQPRGRVDVADLLGTVVERRLGRLRPLGAGAPAQRPARCASWSAAARRRSGPTDRPGFGHRPRWSPRRRHGDGLQRDLDLADRSPWSSRPGPWPAGRGCRPWSRRRP